MEIDLAFLYRIKKSLDRQGPKVITTLEEASLLKWLYDGNYIRSGIVVTKDVFVGAMIKAISDFKLAEEMSK